MSNMSTAPPLKSVDVISADVPLKRWSRHGIRQADEISIKKRDPFFFFGKVSFENPVNNRKGTLIFIMKFAHPGFDQTFDYVKMDCSYDDK